MHPCLDIDEIAVLICSYLPATDLLSVALVSTRFKEPALSILWWNLSGLLPLIHLFPQGTWLADTSIYSHRKDTSQQFHQPLVLQRPLEPIDWLGTRKYTGYVRRFTIIGDTVQDNFFGSVATSFDGTHLFPNLQRLFFVSHTASRTPFLKILLCPTLTHLHLESVTATDDICVLLSQLGTACPSLVSFCCTCTSSEDFLPVRESISQAVFHWACLKEIDVPVLTSCALAHLSQLSRMVCLNLQWDEGAKVVLQDCIHLAGFSSLRALVLYNCTLDYMIESLNAIETSVLEWLKLKLLATDEYQRLQGSWNDFFRAVARRSTSTRLLTLAVHDCIGNLGGPLNIHTIHPILRPRNLTVFDFHDCRHFDLTDSFIEDLAKASPHLTILNIGTWCTGEDNPGLTPEAYIHIFTNCPRIVELGLVINTLDVGDWACASVQGHFTQLGKEVSLYVGDSKVRHPLAVATLLSKFFHEPMGRLLVSNEFFSSKVDEGWDTVKVILTQIIRERIQKITV